jgi:preprotein translocase subunit SecG
MISWIIFVAIILVAIIIKIYSGREKSLPKTKVVEKVTNVAPQHPKEAEKHASDNDHGHVSNAKSNVWANIITTFIVIIVSILLMFGVILGIRYLKNTKPKSRAEYIEHKWIRSDSITISLYDDFGEIHTLNYSDRATFEESTQPYCVINNNNYMECGGKGQDVSKNLGTDNGNKKLRFKSTSGKYGYIKLVIWKEIEIKKYL